VWLHNMLNAFLLPLNPDSNVQNIMVKSTHKIIFVVIFTDIICSRSSSFLSDFFLIFESYDLLLEEICTRFEKL
jgi:hypothetical protein